MYAVPQSPRQAIRMQEVLLALVAARAGALCPHQPTYSQFMYTVSLVSLISGPSTPLASDTPFSIEGVFCEDPHNKASVLPVLC
jgi:hypothetical protein